MIGVQAQLPWSGSATITKTFNQPMTGLWLSNDGGVALTVQVNNDVFTVNPNEVFDEVLPTFTQLIITNAGASAYRAYVRG